jgi:hypothetical protein
MDFKSDRNQGSLFYLAEGLTDSVRFLCASYLVHIFYNSNILVPMVSLLLNMTWGRGWKKRFSKLFHVAQNINILVLVIPQDSSLSLSMVQGTYVRFTYNLGSGPVSIINYQVPIRLGKWYRVYASR